MPPITQGGDGELVDGLQVVGDFVGGGPRVGDLVVEDGVDVDHEVVLGDHRLRAGRQHLFPQVELGAYAVHDGDDEVEARLQGPQVAAEALHVVGARLGDDPYGGHHAQDDKDREGDEDDL